VVGYKQTDIGLIPDDWEAGSISSTTSKRNKYAIVDGPFGSNLKTIHYRKTGIPIISSGFVTEGKFIADSYLYVNKSKFIKEKRSAVNGGDIVMAKIGARCGASAILPSNHKTGILSGNALKITIDHHNHNTYYIWQVLWNLYESGNFNELKSVGAQPAVSMPVLKDFQIPLPPLPEQEAIAEVLSNTDALIGALEKLIAKKRLIKQGAMQTLLTPKDDWEVKKLPDVCWFQEGPGVRKSQFTDRGVKLLNGTNIEKGKLLLDKTERYVSEKEAFGWYSHFLVDIGDILIACSGVSIDKFHEKVTTANKIHLPLCMNTSTMRFKIKSSLLLKDYLIHFLKSKDFKQQISGKATGSAQLNFGPSHVSKVLIKLPSFEEQTHIATILSDMDSEIDVLEKKLSKTKELKQGLMQQLLTGKIRLV